MFKRSLVDFELIAEDDNFFKIYAPYTMYREKEVKFIINDSEEVIGLTVNFERQLDPILFYKKI